MRSEVSQDKLTWIFSVPVVLAAGLMPLIVKLRIMPVHSTISELWPRGYSDADVFSYYKSAAVIILASLTAILLLSGILSHRIKLKSMPVYILLIVFVLTAVLSTVFSEYKHIAYFGFPGRYEGIFVILAYVILFFAALHLFDKEISLKILLTCIIASSVIICFIGVLQFCGLDILKTSVIQNNIMSGAAADTMDIRPGNYAGTAYENAMYSTLFNSNTFGMYISMFFPFSFILTMLVNKKLHIIISAIYSCLMFTCLIGSYSRGAYAGAAAGLLFGLVLLYFKYCTSWKRVVSLSFLFIIVFIIMSFQSGGSISKRFATVVNINNEESSHLELDKIRNFKTEGGTLTLYSQFTELRIKISDNKFSFFDDSNNALDLRPTDRNLYTFSNNKYISYSIQVSGNIINIIKDRSFLLFAVVNNEFIPIDFNGRAIDIRPVKSFGFKGLERFASARGYIWSRSIPLLRNTLFIGHGPDTFAMYFPQDDYLGKLNFMFDANILIDKPHNMYLQTAINTGVISLISLIGLVVYFFVSCIKVLMNRTVACHHAIYAMLISTAIPGYLVAGLFSDSTVSVAPVFWVLLGAALCISHAINTHKANT